jgi:hypothetical protein
VPPARKPYPAADALELLAHESLVVLMIAADMQEGKPIEYARLAKAVVRIQKVRDAANG